MVTAGGRAFRRLETCSLEPAKNISVLSNFPRDLNENCPLPSFRVFPACDPVGFIRGANGAGDIVAERNAEYVHAGNIEL